MINSVNNTFIQTKATKIKQRGSITFEENKNKTENTKTQKFIVASSLTVGIAVGADFIFAKGKHIKSLLKKLCKKKPTKPTTPPKKPTVPDSTPSKPTTSPEPTVIKSTIKYTGGSGSNAQPRISRAERKKRQYQEFADKLLKPENEPLQLTYNYEKEVKDFFKQEKALTEQKKYSNIRNEAWLTKQHLHQEPYSSSCWRCCLVSQASLRILLYFFCSVKAFSCLKKSLTSFS